MLRAHPVPLAAVLALALGLPAPRARAAGAGPECVIPAKAGGGFELTCRLVQAGLAGAGVRAPLRTSYRPGGVGAVAFESAVTQRAAEADTLVAFSSGSLLNLAQGKFSKYSARDVRWVAAIAADHGAIAVRADAPYRSLRDLADALRKSPRSITFGIGGNVGGQDWTKAALFARAAGVDPRALRYVSFEGGGDAFVALAGGHVHVVPGDLAESAAPQARGEIRVLGVLAETRVPGYAAIPTAREQGFAVSWPTIRGVYLGPKVGDRDYARWVKVFDAMLGREDFGAAREKLGLLPFALTGAALEKYVEESVRRYADLARELGLPAR
jgi:putative tricarboxylic transport membrane protein